MLMHKIIFSSGLIALVAMLGCTTPVAIDPVRNSEDTATYRSGTFTGPINASPERIFREAIRVMDKEGYFRTGELHRKNDISIFARRVGDAKVTVRMRVADEGGSNVSIRIGRGNLPESQSLYSKIRAAVK
jgi:hypothetical protein